MTWMQVLILYLAVMNAVGFFLMGDDKNRARKGRWRIPERTLFLVSLLGGSLGSLAGMYCFRHKTRHLAFRFGLPSILIVHIAVAICLKK